MRNRKADRALAAANKQLTGDEGAVPAGGFLLTARPLDSPYPNTRMKGWEGLPIHTFFHRPVILEVTIRNTSDHVLWYLGYSPYNDYVVDVQHGPVRQGQARAVPAGEMPGDVPPFTRYGATLYRPLMGAVGLFSRAITEIELGQSKTVYIFVDQIYDLTLSGLYGISVRHLFPCSQSGALGETAVEYERAYLSRQEVPEISAYAVSNSLLIFVARDSVVHDFSWRPAPP